jgi:hypothetical protein
MHFFSLNCIPLVVLQLAVSEVLQPSTSQSVAHRFFFLVVLIFYR